MTALVIGLAIIVVAIPIVAVVVAFRATFTQLKVIHALVNSQMDEAKSREIRALQALYDSLRAQLTLLKRATATGELDTADQQILDELHERIKELHEEIEDRAVELDIRHAKMAVAVEVPR